MRLEEAEAVCRAVVEDAHGPVTVVVVDAQGIMAIKDGLTAGSPISRTRWIVVRGADFGPLQQRLLTQLRTVAAVEEWDEAAPAPALPAADIPSTLPGCCLFTSGSTGVPKGVLIGHNDLYDRAAAEVEWYGLKPTDVLLNILPFSFDVGLNQLLSAVHVGCELVLLDSWFPRDIMKAVKTRQVTGISSVPSIWLDFMAKGQQFETAGAHRSLRYLTVSGGDMSKLHLDLLPGIAPGVQIFKTYGQTEAFRATSLKPPEFAARPTSVGRPFAGVQLYIVRPDGTRADPGEQGEVVHSGLGVMLGYLGGQDPQNKLRPNPFQGDADKAAHAVFTGDLGHLDAEGYLFLAGRRDDMVKITGNRVYPLEVRDQLLTVEGVLLAEVVPVKTADQTRLAAFVILRPEAKLEPAAIQAHLAARVPSYMVPEKIVLKSEFPRTASGKPDRPALAAEALPLFAPAT